MSTRKACIVCSQEFAGDDAVCPNDGTILTPLLTDRYVGTVLAGRYEVQEVIGGGGMGLVYKARHTMMNRIVAIKMLHSHLTTSAETLKRFQLEAQAASCLSLPNILTIYDFGVTDEGQPYMVMDYLEGTSLADVLETEGHVAVLRALHIFLQCCAGLAHAHQKGVIHRDLKPSNIMLVNYSDQEDFVKIVDFGIAKLLNRVDTSANLTRTGEVYGSPLYMSPEQCRGHELDARSDIYSFGCVMYKTLTGVPIFAGTEMIELLFKQVSEQPKPFSEVCPEAEVPDELERIVFKVLAKDPANRYQSMTELKDALEAFRAKLEGGGQEDTAAAAAESAGRPGAAAGVPTSSHNIPAGPLALAMTNKRSQTAEHSNPLQSVAASASTATPEHPVKRTGDFTNVAPRGVTPPAAPSEPAGRTSGPLPQQAAPVPVEPENKQPKSGNNNGNNGSSSLRQTMSPESEPQQPDRFDRLRSTGKPEWVVLVESIFHNRVAAIAAGSVIIGTIVVAIMIATTMSQSPNTVSPPNLNVPTGTATTTPPATDTTTESSTTTGPTTESHTSTATGNPPSPVTTTRSITVPPTQAPQHATTTHTTTAPPPQHATTTHTTTVPPPQHATTTHTTTAPPPHAAQHVPAAAAHGTETSGSHAAHAAGGSDKVSSWHHSAPHHRRHAYSSYGY